jgi:flagellar basal-body rod protein FlgB
MKLFDATLTTLEHALDVRLTRQNVLAGNLANADTPGFVPREVDFAAAMEALPAAPAAPGAGPQAPVVNLVAFHPGDLPLGEPNMASAAAPERFVHDAPGAGAGAGLDGNAVDVDRTLAAVAENALQYGAAAKAAAKKLAILRYVASDGAA